MLKKTTVFILSLCCYFLHAEKFDPSHVWENAIAKQEKSHTEFTQEKSRAFFKQWFLGPLLVPAPNNANFHHPAFEPSVTGICNYGRYKDNWNVGTSVETQWSVLYDYYVQVGFPKYFGIDIIGNVLSNYTKSASYTGSTDTTVRLGYQIATDKKIQGDWVPSLRLIFQEIFPTGKYQNLKPSRNGIDALGQGSFQSGFYLAAEKGFNFHTNHAFNLYGAFGYILPANFTVKRNNLYGGNIFTKGKIRPGSIFSVFISGEVEISKRISLAFDSNYQQNLKGTFTGNMGSGTPVNVPQMVTFSLAAPEIEITLSEKSGFVIGPWYTLGGQNTPAFVSFFVAYLVIF